MTPCAVTLLASREPVPSRFPAACRGSSADGARRNHCEHLALPFLGRYFRSSPCKPPFRAKEKASFLTSVPPLVFRAEVRTTSQGRTAQALRDAAEKVHCSVKKLAMSSFPFNSHEFSRDGEEQATCLVMSEGIRAFELSMPSLLLLPILWSTLRERTHRKEARIRSGMTRCARRFGTILQAQACVTLAALFDVFFDETRDHRPDENTISEEIITDMRGADLIFSNQYKNCNEIYLAGYFSVITDVVFFLNRHHHTTANASTATNNTTKTTHTITFYHILTHAHPFPAQIQPHFIPSGTSLAQLCQDSCFVHDANMFARQGMSQSTRTPTLRQVRAVCTREKREDKRGKREREKREEKRRERKKDRQKDREGGKRFRV